MEEAEAETPWEFRRILGRRVCGRRWKRKGCEGFEEEEANPKGQDLKALVGWGIVGLKANAIDDAEQTKPSKHNLN